MNKDWNTRTARARGNVERPDTRWKLVTSTRRAVPIAAVVVLAATALGAYGARPAARESASFLVRVTPPRQAIAAGSSARYRISITRPRLRGTIDFSVAGTPRNARPQLTGGGTATRTLTVITNWRTPIGRYRLSVRARSGAVDRVIPLVLTISAPKPAPFISGASGSSSATQDSGTTIAVELNHG